MTSTIDTSPLIQVREFRLLSGPERSVRYREDVNLGDLLAKGIDADDALYGYVLVAIDLDGNLNVTASDTDNATRAAEAMAQVQDALNVLEGALYGEQ